jgi:hypothetical protein
VELNQLWWNFKLFLICLQTFAFGIGENSRFDGSYDVETDGESCLNIDELLI